MSEAEERLSQTEIDENSSGVVLGYWDHEDTPNLIQDLEETVNLVEFKCKKLLEELTHYKKYLEKPGEIDFHLAVTKKKNKKVKNLPCFSGSEPEIAFRKNLIKFKKKRQIFEEEFQDKLIKINKELSEAAYKIGLKDGVILLPTNDNHKKLKEQIEDEGEPKEIKKEEGSDVREKFIELSTFTVKAKSDSVITKNNGDSDFSKITKTQLELYQKLSKLSMKNRGIKKSNLTFFKRKKVKFCPKRKNHKFCRGFLMRRDRLKKSKPYKKTSNKMKSRLPVIQAGQSYLPRDFNYIKSSRGSEIVKICETSVSPVGKASHKFCEQSTRGERGTERNSALKTVSRKNVPFIVCTSTSRSHNISLNMRQLFSLKKNRKNADVRISTSEKIHGGTGGKTTKNLISKTSVADVKKRHSAPWTHSQAKSNSFEREKHRGSAWVSERCTSSDFRKVRSKNTGRSPNAFIKYFKSTTGKFMNGQKSMIKSESKTAYASGSKLVFSDCQRTDIFEIGKTSSYFKDASGDGNSNGERYKLNIKWTKMYTSFLKTYRKYVCLKEKVSGRDLALVNEELKSLEKDIDYSIEKYKEFLQYYTKFLLLNHHLKSFKIACESETFEPVTSFSSNSKREFWDCKPTLSMTMKNAFRKVQTLQDKINLVDD